MTPPTPRGRRLRISGKLLAEDSRRHHRSMLLQELFSHGPASRADLARSTGLTRVTVSDLVGDMLRDGLVSELGAPAEARVGKPPTLIGFEADAACVASLDLSRHDTLTGALLSMSGEVLRRRTVRLGGQRGERALTRVRQLARTLVGLADRPVLGVGVGSPGVVSPDGAVVDAPNLGWHEVDLTAYLGDDLDLPVYVGNDANVATLGENTFGEPAEGGMLLIRIGQGVGAGLVLDGQVVHGHRFAAGEIGHVVVDDRGEQCACGRRGCLETLLAVPTLRDRVDDGNPTRVLAGAGTRLGTAIAPVVAALNLHQVVLSGPEELLEGTLTDAAAQTIRDRTMAVTGDDLVVRTSKLGDDVVLVGATVLVLSGELGIS